MDNRLKTALKLVIAFGLGFLIIWLSLRGLNGSERENIINSFRSANYFWVLISIALGILSHYLRAIRWKILLKPLGYTPKTSSSFLSVMVGYFANLGLPRAGEVVRCSVLYKEEKIPVDKSFGTVIVERAIDMILFIILFIIAFVVEYSKISNYVNDLIMPKLNNSFGAISSSYFILKVFAILFIISGVIVAIFKSKLKNTSFVKKVTGLISGVWQGLKSISQIDRPFLFVILTLGIWFLYYLMIYLCFFAISELSGLSPFAGLSVLVLGTVGIMVTPGGIGLYPVIVAQTLVFYGYEYNNGIGLALGWIAWSAQTVMILIVGSISLFITTLKKAS